MLNRFSLLPLTSSIIPLATSSSLPALSSISSQNKRAKTTLTNTTATCLYLPNQTISPFSRRCYSESTQVSPKVQELADKLMGLDRVESHLLAEYIQRESGLPDEMVSAIIAAQQGQAAGMMMAAPAEAPKEEAEEEEKAEKTIFKVVITGVEDMAKNKLKVIKALRNFKPGEPLDVSKGYVTNLPSTFLNEVPKEDAEKMKTELSALGAIIELQ